VHPKSETSDSAGKYIKNSNGCQNNKAMRKLIYILIPVIALFGCFSNVDERLLMGKYHFNTYKSDVIDVHKDHTYEHKYVNTKGKVFECHGKWRYNGKEISFHDFNFFNDLGTTGGDGVWISEVTEDNGTIKLNYSDDDDTYFEKE
jgi:hypothetical protein